LPTQDDPVVIVLATIELRDFAENFLCHAKRYSLPGLVLALDMPCIDVPARWQCIRRTTPHPIDRREKQSVLFSSPAYAQAVEWKLLEHLRWVNIANDGDRLLFIDVDVVVRGELGAVLPPSPIVFSRNECGGTVPKLNSGFYAVVATNSTRSFMHRARVLQRKRPRMGDQGAFQELVYPDIAREMNNQAEVELLPCAAVAPGYKLPSRSTAGLAAFHMNYVSNSSTKIACLQAAGWWLTRGQGQCSELMERTEMPLTVTRHKQHVMSCSASSAAMLAVGPADALMGD
jgi:hypothetical protein